MAGAIQMIGRALAGGGLDPVPARPVIEVRVPRSARDRDGATWLARLGAVLTVVAAAWWLSAASAGPAARRIPVRHGFRGIPLAARGPVSAALGQHQAAYAVIGLHARNPAQRLSIVGTPGASGNDSRPAAGSTYVLDLAAPETAIDAAPALTNDRTPTFTFHATEPANSRCSIDTGRGSFTPCSGPGDSHTPPQALADGTYTFRVAAVDRAGNADPTPATKQFTVNTVIADTTPPQTKLTKHPKKTLTLSAHKKTAPVMFGFAASEPRSSFRCKLDKRPFTRCTSPTTYRLKKGKPTFRVAATDAAGNTDPSPTTFTLVVRATPRHQTRRSPANNPRRHR